MNDDLISRKALLEDIENSMMQNPHQDIKVRQNHNHEHRHFFCMVTQEPTAFDKEKVIEELKKCKKIMLSPANIDCFGEPCRENDCMACVFEKAIEIVEKGGIG